MFIIGPERRDLDGVLFFQSLDSVHCTHRYTHCLHHQKLHLRLVFANWLLVLDEEVVLVQQSENLKRFQAHLEVLHRFHLNSWAETSWPSAVYLAALLPQFFFPSVFVDPVSVCLLDFVVTLNDYSHDSVDPRLLNFHLHSELADSAVFPEEGYNRLLLLTCM